MEFFLEREACPLTCYTTAYSIPQSISPFSPPSTPLRLPLGASRLKYPPALWQEPDQRPCCYFHSCFHNSPCGRKEKCHLDKDTEHKEEKKKKTKSDTWESLDKNGLCRLSSGGGRRSEPGGRWGASGSWRADRCLALRSSFTMIGGCSLRSATALIIFKHLPFIVSFHPHNNPKRLFLLLT